MNTTSPWQAIILGIIQGLTEFLPVSSSGHLIVSSWILQGSPLPLSLNIALHFGTTIAVVFYFWRDWYDLGLDFLHFLARSQKPKASNTLLFGLLLGSIPAGIIGILWEEEIERIFHHPISVAIPLAGVGILIWLSDRKAPSTRTLKTLRIKDAVIIGCAQACALIPGVSRSGITMMAGRLLSFHREDAARFSFLLGTPAMVGAMLLKSKDILANTQNPSFYLGILCSFFTGILAIKFLLRFLKHFGFGVFAIYRIILAILIVCH